MIRPGALATWTPSEDLFRIFPRDTAFRLYKRVPLTGMVARIDGNAAMLACDGPKGIERFPVLVSELSPVVAHGSE